MENDDQLPIIEWLNQTKTKEMLEDFKSEKVGWVLVDHKKWFYFSNYAKQCPIYYNFKVKSDDTWLFTFPRSGTTWASELIWLISHDLDFTTASTVPQETRFPFLEQSMVINEGTSQNVIIKGNQSHSKIKALLSYEVAQSMSEPRFMKTHFPLSLVPNVLKSKCKIIYVARNPKDVAVSFYHFQKAMISYNYHGDFEKFWDYFQNNLICWSPYWEHIKEAWMLKDNPNFLFLFYEDMTHNLIDAAKKVAQFFNKSYSDDQYERLFEYLQISNFKNNNMVNFKHEGTKALFKEDVFIRKGKSETWHDMFSAELKIKANKWIEENLKKMDLEFPYINIYS